MRRIDTDHTNNEEVATIHLLPDASLLGAGAMSLALCRAPSPACRLPESRRSRMMAGVRHMMPCSPLTSTQAASMWRFWATYSHTKQGHYHHRHDTFWPAPSMWRFWATYNFTRQSVKSYRQDSQTGTTVRQDGKTNETDKTVRQDKEARLVMQTRQSDEPHIQDR